MSSEAKPDLIIGIDLGQTCTGVAYNVFAQGNNNIRWIQKWPGRSQANENKVPTTLYYPHGHSRPSSWGFRAEVQAEQSPERGTIREWFKTLLDPENLIREKDQYAEDSTSHEDVRHWFRDYLVALYEHIKLKLASELPNFEWSLARVEFLFSVPTTWNHGTVEQFRLILGQAGFGGPASASHSVTIGLTEPEAVAVYCSTAAAGIFREDDVLVVCDAGGGTTDLSALKVTETAVGALSLKQLRQLDVVAGQNVGSAAIDFEFEKLARARLKAANRHNPLEIDIEHTAWEMAKGGDYHCVKCEHGAPDETPGFSVVVPRLRHDYVSTDARIEGGEMHFNKEDMRALFDHQIKKLFALIDNQLKSLSQKMPEENISHLVLSGGLGQSPYVQQRLRDRYGEGSYTYANAQTMQVRVAPDPQLAVCKGLVADRLRKLKAGEGVLGWRCCRASYGLICKELYNKNNPKHFMRKTERDARDGKLYVPDCVDWFVEKGTPVSLDKPIEHNFRRKVSPGDPRKVFPTKVVVSYKDKEALPCQLEPGVEKLCEVESDLSGADESRFKERNKQFWKPGEAYYEVSYQVKVMIGPADLRFELWFESQKMSTDHPIKVEWASTTASSTAVLEPPPIPFIQDDPVPTAKRSGYKLRRLFSGAPPTP